MVNVAKYSIYEAHGKVKHHAQYKELCGGGERVGSMQIIHKIQHLLLVHAILVDEIVELGFRVLPAHVLAG